jgi:hypothetical protein
MQALAEQASHDPEIDAMLCAWGATLVEQTENMPKPLRAFIANRLRSIGSAKTKTGKRGRHPYANFDRDFIICYAVARLVERGFAPTRNRNQRTTASACSVVTAALGRLRAASVDEEAVEKIWRSRATRIPSTFRQYIDEGREDIPHGLALYRIVGN